MNEKSAEVYQRKAFIVLRNSTAGSRENLAKLVPDFHFHHTAKMHPRAE